ncbi:MAG: TetR/AcrR family transcriptional regulator [Myxococcales bacterium]|nr:TetR/AcrR family transcriptional regulator [Myxococcales bacterium]
MGDVAPTRAAGPRRSAEATRERLLEAARHAFSELGFVATRVDDIVEQAGVSHGTFYRYFTDKKDILITVTQDVASTLYGTAVAPPVQAPTSLRDVVRERLGAFVRAYSRDWQVVRSWRQAEGVYPEVEEIRSKVRQAIIGAIAEMLDQDGARELLAEGVDPRIAASAFVVMAEGFADEWLTVGRAIREEDVDQLCDLWVRGTYGDAALRPPGD